MEVEKNKLMTEEKAIKVKRTAIEDMQEVDDIIVTEFNLNIIVNGKKVFKIICSECMLEEVVIGRLYTDRFINDYSDIKSIIYHENEQTMYVEIEGDGLPGKVEKESTDRDEEKIVLTKENIDFLMEKSEKMLFENPLFDMTGALHSALLYYGPEKRQFHSIDLGRHHAIDKVIGMALREGVDLTKCVLFSTGRVPTDMIAKAVRSHMPMMVSRGAVTKASIDIAKENNMFLSGFSRGSRMNIYSLGRFELEDI